MNCADSYSQMYAFTSIKHDIYAFYKNMNLFLYSRCNAWLNIMLKILWNEREKTKEREKKNEEREEKITHKNRQKSHTIQNRYYITHTDK